MLGKDKLYHFIAGFLIAVLLGFWNPVVALFASGIAGFGKEAYDMYIKKSFADPVDAIATILGGIFGTAASIVIINIIC